MWVKPEDHKVVGEVFLEARTKADLTQQELARRLKKPQSFISAYEGGQRRIDVLEFLVIAGALEADPLTLFRRLLDLRGKKAAQTASPASKKSVTGLRLRRKIRFL